VHAVAARAVVRRRIERNDVLSTANVEVSEGALDGVAIASSPPLVTVAEGRARRAIAPGEILTTALVRLPYAVRAGDQIKVVFRHGGIEARGAGTAVNSGAVGDIVRVLAPGRRQPLRARIVAPAVVEILQ
jgi:flagella basal body P-ring formation protein FlgA